MKDNLILPHGVITPDTGGDAWLTLIFTSAGLFAAACMLGFMWFRYIKGRVNPLPKVKRTAISKIVQIIDSTENRLNTNQHYRIWVEVRSLTLFYWGEQSVKLDIDAYIEQCTASVKEERRVQLQAILSRLHQAIYNPSIHIDKQHLLSVLVPWIQEGIHEEKLVQQGLQP
jgi:hypothetical protein